jgi:hypothetical protein
MRAYYLQGVESDTTSVMSSIYRFREENGRTYHAYRASGECPSQHDVPVPCSDR